ncbi:AAA family ATPase [Mycobacterium marinum]|nr:AAA family ATPase [Mycobacterium marinum]MDC8985578.1 AAA family ATPase [Mycobacterium marinum]MDC9002873.1 AAA family ATPase [Mycobacterium marinum]MDC9013610.1 AAA family ATPase [Mycobacterium marinum]MDC9018965.1 AAA family ATPase [Mycobacterium marinum]
MGIQRLQSHWGFVYLANPTIGVRGMLTHIVRTPAFHRSALTPQAAEALATEHAERGRNPALVVDEAHFLDNHQLEAIRLLTNHDMDSGSPFAVILIGQPSLRQRLRLGVLAALDQRTVVRYHIGGMRGTDTGDYIRHHCKISGRADTLFSEDAIGLIHNASRGHPRAVNNLALPALTAAFAADHSIVDEREHASRSPKPPPIEPIPRQPDHHSVSPATTLSTRTQRTASIPMTPSSSA